MHSRKSSSDLSWASSSSLSDTYEGNYGTVKRRNPSEQPPPSSSSPGGGEAEESEEGGGTPGVDPAYKTVTSSTDRGLIGEGPRS